MVEVANVDIAEDIGMPRKLTGVLEQVLVNCNLGDTVSDKKTRKIGIPSRPKDTSSKANNCVCYANVKLPPRLEFVSEVHLPSIVVKPLPEHGALKCKTFGMPRRFNGKLGEP